ncbi:MAG: PIG-L deacetylase family protein [Acidimicrobiales bacterium]
MGLTPNVRPDRPSLSPRRSETTRVGSDSPISVDISTPRRALAVGAHPDDIEFGCGGTLAKWASSGCAVYFAILTDGSKGTWSANTSTPSLVATREAEQREAARRIGTNEVTFLGSVDGELTNSPQVRRQVSQLIRTLQPDVVLGHDPWRMYRLHPDHRAAGWILTDSIVAARDPLFFPDQGLNPHRPEKLLLWEAEVTNHVENVSGYLDAKFQALIAHRSQHETTMGVEVSGTGDGDTDFSPLYEWIVSELSSQGEAVGVLLGESFHLITDL